MPPIAKLGGPEGSAFPDKSSISIFPTLAIGSSGIRSAS